MSLNPQQEKFVSEYVKDGNGLRAAVAAGYSAKTAAAQASRLLKNVNVAAAIEKLRTKIAKKLDISAERVFGEMAKLAFFDPRKLYNEDGSLKRIHELDDETAAAIAGIDEEELFEHFSKGQAKEIGKVKKVKFADKGQNLERLAKLYLKVAEVHKHQIENIEDLTDEQLAALAVRLGCVASK